MLLASLSSFALLLRQEVPAQGAEGPAAGPGLSNMLVPVVLIFGIFYLLVILPERRKQKERQAVLGRLKKGDRVITTGGMHGKVAQVQENVVTLQVADGVRLRFNRSAVLEVNADEKVSEKVSEKAGEQEAAAPAAEEASSAS